MTFLQGLAQRCTEPHKSFHCNRYRRYWSCTATHRKARK